MRKLDFRPAETAALSVTVVRVARLESTLGAQFLHHHLYGEPDGPYDLGYYLWIIRGGERTVIVDTGMSAAAAARRGRELFETFEQVLERHGITEADLVITHAHYDHLGGIAVLKSGRVYVGAAELDFWASETAKARVFEHLVEADEIETLLALRGGDRLVEVAGTLDIAPGIRLIEAGGHTPGQLMVSVTTDAGLVLLTSDVVHFDKEYEQDRPFAHTANVPGLIEVFAAIRDGVADGTIAHVISGHDARVLDTPGATSRSAEAGGSITIGTVADGAREHN